MRNHCKIPLCVQSLCPRIAGQAKLNPAKAGLILEILRVCLRLKLLPSLNVDTN